VLAELLRQPGVDEVVELRSSFGFLAIHGGSLERMTDTIAREAARRAGASYYGVHQPEGFRWHIPSKAFDPSDSTGLRRFLDHVEVAVAVHGYGRNDHWTTVLLGGGNRPLAGHLAERLRSDLPDYRVVDEVAAIPKELRGMHPENPVNRPPAAGVQVELPPRIRGLGPFWAEHGDGLTPHTEALVDGLATAARSWPPAGGRR
jgi:phage replication-related protein YjqB (UPF0714/DUF867 family)